MLRKAALALLREDERPVGDHVVLALRALERDGVVPCLRQRGRETRGPAVVTASDRAVEDLDGHARRLLPEAGTVALDDRGRVDARRQRAVRAPTLAAKPRGAEGIGDLGRRVPHEQRALER